MGRYAGMSQGAPSDEVRRILLRYRRLAVVGLSPTTSRPSYRAMVHMRAYGYDITPVNPGCDTVLGFECVPTLADAAAKGPLEIVDIFRKVEDIPPIVDEAIELGAKVIWMQLGLADEAAADRARAAGIEVVMDRCVKMEHCRYFGGLNIVGLSTGVVASRRFEAFA
ncbi:MAG TPA: CoA-binding protein [Miltoncostaeaceae bacterium]|nr:CoA-binding protein [Miltoncostaeaceae bacterium]